MLSYNHERFIGDTINSISEQVLTGLNVEYIFVDDASTDNTQKVILEKASVLKNVRCHFMNRNLFTKGININWIYGIGLAKGRFIAFCEGDDFWLNKNRLSIQAAFLTNNPDIACVGGNKVNILESVFRDNFVSKDISGTSMRFSQQQLRRTFPFYPGTAMYRNLVNWPESSLRFWKPRDIHLYEMISAHGDFFKMEYNFLAYRRHDGGIHSSVSRRRRALQHVRFYFELFCFTWSITYLKNTLINIYAFVRG